MSSAEFSGERDGHFIGQLNWRLPAVQQAIREKWVPRISTLTTDDAFYADETGVHDAMASYLCYRLQERGWLVKFVQRAQALKDSSSQASGLRVHRPLVAQDGRPEGLPHHQEGCRRDARSIAAGRS